MPHRTRVVEYVNFVVLGERQVEGQCPEVVNVMMHGRIYADGTSNIAWHVPGDPMTGGSRAATDDITARLCHELWAEWAQAGVVTSGD